MPVVTYSISLLFTLILITTTCFAQQPTILSDKLQVTQLTPNTMLHISDIVLSNGSVFPCNGVIYINGREAIVIDTPPTDSTTERLIIRFTSTYPGVTIKAVIATHFHEDCLGGLNAFHKRGIASYANNRTIKFAKKKKFAVPQYGFKKQLDLKVGDAIVTSSYHGAAHTKDNIVSWIPSEKVLFGGCMVKEVGAGKGNIADAVQSEWPSTVRKVKAAYPAAEIIVPGHGASGGKELLDYTIRLFED